ncbi:MAG: fibrillarin-like rRNA/tRNA 2'-O-methyltransferase [Candidatus Micrarchaeia archaeon]
MKELFEGVYLIEGKLATKNLSPGFRVYGEKLVNVGGAEYRFWDPYRSKLAAAIKNGLKTLPIKRTARVLYLGAASGTTASHVSDIIEKNGVVFCVEFAPRAMRDLLKVCEKRENMVPILADARMPESYSDIGKVDVIYEDVAQPEQAEIMVRNASRFLVKSGWAMIAIKSQSIDAVRDVEETFKNTVSELEETFDIVEKIRLEPYDRAHLFLLMSYR